MRKTTGKTTRKITIATTRLPRVLALAALVQTGCGRVYEPGDLGFFSPPTSSVKGWLVPETPDGKLMSPREIFESVGKAEPLFTERDIEAIELVQGDAPGGEPAFRLYFKKGTWTRIRYHSTRMFGLSKAGLAVFREGKVVAMTRHQFPFDAGIVLRGETGRVPLLMTGLRRVKSIDRERFRFDVIEWLKTYVLDHPEDLFALHSLAHELEDIESYDLAMDAYEEMCRLAPVAHVGSAAPIPPPAKIVALKALSKLYRNRRALERGIKFFRSIHLELGRQMNAGAVSAVEAYKARSVTRLGTLELYTEAKEIEHARKLAEDFLKESRAEAMRFKLAGVVNLSEIAILENFLRVTPKAS